MYLLNNKKIKACIDQHPPTYLNIKNFSLRMLNPTSYYFRLGWLYKYPGANTYMILSEENSSIVLKPSEYVIVQSMEELILSDKVFAILGPSTDLAMMSVSLHYGQFIDPLFDGRLEVGLRNFSTDEVSISIGEILGKICFFDISDTYPVDKIVGDTDTIYKRKMDHRRKLTDEHELPPWMLDDDVVAFMREKEQQDRFGDD